MPVTSAKNGRYEITIRVLAKARLLQERLRGQIVTEDQLSVVQRVAGVDTHYDVNRLWAGYRGNGISRSCYS